MSLPRLHIIKKIFKEKAWVSRKSPSCCESRSEGSCRCSTTAGGAVNSRWTRSLRKILGQHKHKHRAWGTPAENTKFEECPWTLNLEGKLRHMVWGKLKGNTQFDVKKTQGKRQWQWQMLTFKKKIPCLALCVDFIAIQGGRNFVRSREGPLPKSLDSIKNFKPKHTLFSRNFKIVAFYAHFG